MSRQGQDEDSLYERIQETSAFLQKHTKRAPRFGLILGTGLGDGLHLRRERRDGGGSPLG